MRRHANLALGLLLSLAFIGAACSSTSTTATSGSGSTPAPSGPATSGTTAGPVIGTINVSAAASLNVVFKTIGDDFKKANPGSDVVFNFDSSTNLAKSISSGESKADVFASADDASMKPLADANLMAPTPTLFARNQLTLVVKKGNPKNIKTLADLATAGTISLCAGTAPCGKYADQILTKASITVPADKTTRGNNATATLTAVSEGDADAGIVYVTDVTGDKVESVAIADAQNAIADYPIGVVKATTNMATAQAFMAYVLSPPAQATLKAAGFLPPT
jgi:molybdate transport system substrate-binding protein